MFPLTSNDIYDSADFDERLGSDSGFGTFHDFLDETSSPFSSLSLTSELDHILHDTWVYDARNEAHLKTQSPSDSPLVSDLSPLVEPALLLFGVEAWPRSHLPQYHTVQDMYNRGHGDDFLAIFQPQEGQYSQSSHSTSPETDNATFEVEDINRPLQNTVRAASSSPEVQEQQLPPMRLSRPGAALSLAHPCESDSEIESDVDDDRDGDYCPSPPAPARRLPPRPKAAPRPRVAPRARVPFRSRAVKTAARSTAHKVRSRPYPDSSSCRARATRPSRRNGKLTPERQAYYATHKIPEMPQDGQCPECPFMQRNLRSADFKRHFLTHMHVEIYCGITLAEAEVQGRKFSASDVISVNGFELVGGCGMSMCRLDAYQRHAREAAAAHQEKPWGFFLAPMSASASSVHKALP